MATASLGGEPSKACEQAPHHFVPIVTTQPVSSSVGRKRSHDQMQGETENSVYPSEFSGKPASSFTATNAEKFVGVGFNSILIPYDPTLIDKRKYNPSKLLLPTYELLQSEIVIRCASLLFRSIVSNIDMTKISETKNSMDEYWGRMIQRHHLDLICAFFKGSLLSTTMKENSKTMAQLNCSEGTASSTSVPDGFGFDAEGNIRCIIEAKSNVASTLEGGRQGLSEAINVALSQVKKGVPVENVVIPIISTTGSLMQILVVVFLLPLFPMTFNLSKVLDLADSNDRLLAAAHLFKINELLKTPLEHGSSLERLPTAGLSQDLYHLKKSSQFFLTLPDLHSSALYFLHVMSTLRQSENCRRLVLFPFCFGQWKESYQIIFPKLRDYRIGLPSSQILRRQFLALVEEALIAIHCMGVVHLDWYPSNFMWTYSEDSQEMHVKIIDFDSAHIIVDGLSEKTLSRLGNQNQHDRQFLTDREVHGRMDLRNYDLSLMKLLQKYAEHDGLCTPDKSELDECFNSIMHQEVAAN
eukprot:CAMPEP_0170072288 /NCGR_PEP_ID=MMETSP0019_2-20121128/9964_1 /TAXON_ID=98059 /ORGANISM="Dinobryon sp., Strain UTEXLB2267" /LENGTH=525 /DNA_ID=CAMNT_0010281185 /DNA_START=1 /DNA_END=1578 /DNA_ORIENTATION=-